MSCAAGAHIQTIGWTGLLSVTYWKCFRLHWLQNMSGSSRAKTQIRKKDSYTPDTEVVSKKIKLYILILGLRTIDPSVYDVFVHVLLRKLNHRTMTMCLHS
jgi:hypothetical protein